MKAVPNHVHYLVELSVDCADKKMEERVNKVDRDPKWEQIPLILDVETNILSLLV